MIIEEGLFKEKPVIVIKSDDGKRIMFSAGLKKINIIIQNIEALKAFAEKYKDNI